MDQDSPFLSDNSNEALWSPESSGRSSGSSRSRHRRRSTSRDRTMPIGRRLSRRMSKREKKKAAAAAAAVQEEINRELASLQLPHMPASIMSSRPSFTEEQSGGGATVPPPSRTNNNNEPPTIRILVVADIDLESASALAETALGSSSSSTSTENSSDRTEENPLRKVDLCIACGPFCQEDDLRKYYEGRQRRRHLARRSNYANSAAPIWAKRGGSGNNNALLPLPPMPQPPQHQLHHLHTYQTHHHANHSTATSRNAAQHHATQNRNRPSTAHNPHYHHQQHHHHQQQQHQQQQQYPSKRTREETAALEGLVTAALSQLESIVCRVVFVPGKSDPLTTITSSPTSIAYSKERRLTPNSRNIHQHWMPLGPGLGCAGLLYLDGQRLQQQPPPLEDDEDDDDEDEDDDDEEDDVEDSESSSLVPEDSSISYNPDEANSGAAAAAAGHPSNPLPGASYDERAKEYGKEFCDHLQDLVELAPPLDAISDSPPSHAQITNLLKTKRFQSILVTQFHHLERELGCDPSAGMSSFSTTTHDVLQQPPPPVMSHNQQSTNYTAMDAYGLDFPVYSSYPSASGAPGTGIPHYSQDKDGKFRSDMDNGKHPGTSNTMHHATFQDPLYNPTATTSFDGSSTTTAMSMPPLPPQAAAYDDVDEEEEESFDPPWPTEHEAFCALPVVQEHVLLEIAAGRNSKGQAVRPMELPKGPTMRVVLPGSLRERGEYCVVDVAFMKSPYGAGGGGGGGGSGGTGNAGSGSGSSGGVNGKEDDYRWRVKRTRFHTVSDFV